MIISDKYKYIFIRPQKVGGTSVLRALPKPHRRFEKDNKQWIQKQTGRSMDPYHIPAEHVAQLIPEDKLNEYFKFSIVRNPYDRIVSLYHYLTRMNKHKYNTFDKFIHNIYKVQWYGIQMSQSKFIGNVDYTIRFEELQTGFNKVCDRLNLPHRQLQHYKKTQDRTHYKNYYCDVTKQIVTEMFQEDLNKFDYKF